MTYIVIKVVLPELVNELTLGSLHTQCPKPGSELLHLTCTQIGFSLEQRNLSESNIRLLDWKKKTKSKIKLKVN